MVDFLWHIISLLLKSLQHQSSRIRHLLQDLHKLEIIITLYYCNFLFVGYLGELKELILYSIHLVE